MKHLLAAILYVAVAAAAQAEPACAAYKWPLDREKALLANPAGEVQSGADATWEAGVGQAFVLKLQPLADVPFAVPPERKPEDPSSFAGVVRLPAVAAGRYQISLAGHAWIDAVQNGGIVASDDHTGQGGCPVRKSVRFTFKAAPVTLQLSGVTEDKIGVVVTPAGE